MTANNKTKALFAKTLRKYKKRMKHLESNVEVFKEFLNLHQEKSTDYINGLEDFADEFKKLGDRLEVFKGKVQEIGGNPRIFDHEIDRLFFDVNVLKDMNANCK